MYRQNNSKEFSFQFIFVMLLYLIIVVLSIMIISLGKNIYDRINEDRNTNYQVRVSLAYLANKIRQSDKIDSLEIQDLHGINSLVINEVYDGENYRTWIYYYDGALYEMFTDEDSDFDPADGMKVVEVNFFEIEKIKDNLYKFTAHANEEKADLYLTLYAN